MISQRVAVIIGSTRANRIGPEIAVWVRDALREGSSLHYELVDLAEVALPFLDEPRMPALGEYAHAHTRAWSELILSFDAVVFVFPQYNGGYPGVLKNAVDFLYAEWRDKPAALVSYGTRGGNRAAAGFLAVLNRLHLRVIDTSLELALPEADKDAAGHLREVEATLAPYRDQVRALDAGLTAALAAPA
ncbi:NAD(P)H-dependent oxidoreductase [Klugiella xanthotipulae]|uniref:NAD(P)H-dependent FMN reductase n=1 Tax=Klugiella xanthotipulae TaxID=244735 RepID=A0A543I701_9MICO|nr:NAD(P)H-dependent oxidoreductase [Klugiella xanthotipulae]TQM66383.1 NAD(P)H-dependent FMN reductase [Klugiella xanthotipulae]